VTFSAGWQKIFSPLPRVGFLAQATLLESAPQTSASAILIFNSYLDAVVCGVFLVLVAVVLVDSLRLWYGIIRGTETRAVQESPFVLSGLQSEQA